LQVPTGVTNFGTSTTTGSFFTGFQFNPQVVGSVDNTMSDGASTSAAPLCIHKATDGLGYNIGIAYRDQPAATARVFDTSDEFVAGATLFLVGKYFIGPGNKDDVASLFINPASLSAEPGSPTITSSIASTGSTGFDYFWDTS